jgi:hypothetical protein
MTVVRALDKKIFGPVPAAIMATYYHIADGWREFVIVGLKIVTCNDDTVASYRAKLEPPCC